MWDVACIILRNITIINKSNISILTSCYQWASHGRAIMLSMGSKSSIQIESIKKFHKSSISLYGYINTLSTKKHAKTFVNELFTLTLVCEDFLLQKMPNIAICYLLKVGHFIIISL